MANILSFPSTFFAENPETPERTSPSAEEAAMNRPRRGLKLVPLGGFGVGGRGSTLDFSKAIDAVLSQIDGEIARRSGRERTDWMPGTMA